MLWRAVQGGAWPANRQELFELSTELMLREADPDHARSVSGAYTAAELRPVAGAICALRLMSDLDAISSAAQVHDSGEAPNGRGDQGSRCVGRRILSSHNGGFSSVGTWTLLL
jgi:hypothetical protein